MQCSAVCRVNLPCDSNARVCVWWVSVANASRVLAEKHYAVHASKPFYESLVGFITSGPTVAMVWEGREAVNVCRNIIGPTDGANASVNYPRRLRGKHSEQSVDGSDSPENAAQEIALWFKDEELVNWTPVDSAWVVG